MPDNQIKIMIKTYQAQQNAIMRMGSFKDTAPVIPGIIKHMQYQILRKSYIYYTHEYSVIYSACPCVFCNAGIILEIYIEMKLCISL